MRIHFHGHACFKIDEKQALQREGGIFHRINKYINHFYWKNAIKLEQYMDTLNVSATFLNGGHIISIIYKRLNGSFGPVKIIQRLNRCDNGQHWA